MFPFILSVALCVLPSLSKAGPDSITGVGAVRLVTVTGEGSLNNINKKLAQSPRVMVVDQYDTPVVGVEVVFTLPADGPSGTFTGGSRECRKRTDSHGEATADSFKPNTVEGRFFISVSVIHEGMTATLRIPQVNTTAGGILQ